MLEDVETSNNPVLRIILEDNEPAGRSIDDDLLAFVDLFVLKKSGVDEDQRIADELVALLDVDWRNCRGVSCVGAVAGHGSVISDHQELIAEFDIAASWAESIKVVRIVDILLNVPECSNELFFFHNDIIRV